MFAASLTNTQGIIALGAAALALAALVACAALALSLRRLRAAQTVVLGGNERDVVAHAAGMQTAFEDLRDYVGEMAAHLQARLDRVEEGLRGAVTHCALVRYDAYNELSGQQSVSMALLDGTRSGVVLTCIHHREQARVYLKQVRNGSGELELSPEEAEAVRLALSPAPAAAASEARGEARGEAGQ